MILYEAVTGQLSLYQYPPFMVPTRDGPHKTKTSLPVWWPSKPFKIRHLSVCCPRNIQKRKSTWLVGDHKTPPKSQPKPHLLLKHSRSAIGQHHLIASTSLTPPTYTINTTKSWSLTTASRPHAIIKITTHARGCLIKSDWSRLVFFKLKTIVRNDSHISILAAALYSGDKCLQWHWHL